MKITRTGFHSGKPSARFSGKAGYVMGNELDQDFLMSYHNKHGKKSRIHMNTNFLADQRVVLYRCTVTKLRLWNLLPPKETREERILEIPDWIGTKKELYGYVEKHRAYWLHGSRRR